MSRWPEPENKLIPEGHYQFRLNKEPEFRKFSYKGKQGEEKEGVKIVLFMVGLNDKGEFRHIEGIPVWDTRYAMLCQVLQVDHGHDINTVGSIFDGDIKHELDKNDPTKVYARLFGIKACGDVPMDEPDGGVDIPF